jgi:tRNA A-37 threonylcarbamoyl transferase component Bud32
MTKLKAKQISFSQKSDMFRHFQKYVIENMQYDEDSTIKLCEIQRLDDSGIKSPTQSYLLKLKIEKADRSCEFRKIVLKRLNPKTLKYGIATLLSKDFSIIRSVQIPRIIHANSDSGYVLKEFVPGIEVTFFLCQIVDQGYINKQQKKVFKKMGQGLAEIHTRLEIIHNDPTLVNWIYFKEKDNVFLIDWEWGGRGDPAWDLSRLIYDIGRFVSQLTHNSSLKRTDEIYAILNDISLAITNGYANSSKKKREIVRKSASYWIHYSFSVKPEIHDIIFQSCGFPPPPAFVFFRKLLDALHLSRLKKEQTIIRKIFRLFTRLISVTLLVGGKRKRGERIHEFKKLTKLFVRKMKK